jgi:SAM-dependent methyltransferase
MLRSILAHPLTRGRSIDDPVTTDLRRSIITSKPFLRAIYEDWYQSILTRIPDGEGAVLELGSGAGFFQQFVPDVITSEVFECPGVQLVADARNLPFSDGELRAIVMTDVLHHIPNVAAFFREATRCLRSGGAVVMVEPWVSSWSRLIYTHLHHEPFEPEVEQWDFPAKGPLSDANGALPWILFDRDRKRFEEQFPYLKIKEVRPMMPFRYLVSGGVSMRALMPGWTTPLWKTIERACEPQMKRLAMFSLISLRRM